MIHAETQEVSIMKKLSARTIGVTVAGAALFFVLGRYASIPTPVPTVSIFFQYGWLGFIAVVFGPVAGVLAGFLGHLLIDLSQGELFWSWIAASSAFGGLVGLLANIVRIDPANMDRHNLVKFNLCQVAVHVVCWAGIAPVLDIWWYAEPIDKLFDQGLTAAGANAVTTAIVGSALLAAYSAARARATAKK